MPKFTVEVCQVFRVERYMTLEVEAVDMTDAIAEQEAIFDPDMDDPRWTDNWSMESETIVPA